MYTMEVHCRRLAFMCVDERLNIVRAEGMHHNLRRKIGMKCGDSADDSSLTMFFLSENMTGKRVGQRREKMGHQWYPQCSNHVKVLPQRYIIW